MQVLCGLPNYAHSRSGDSFAMEHVYNCTCSKYTVMYCSYFCYYLLCYTFGKTFIWNFFICIVLSKLQSTKCSRMQSANTRKYRELISFKLKIIVWVKFYSCKSCELSISLVDSMLCSVCCSILLRSWREALGHMTLRTTSLWQLWPLISSCS